MCNLVSFSCLESLKKTRKIKLHMVPFRKVVSLKPEKVENDTWQNHLTISFKEYLFHK